MADNFDAEVKNSLRQIEGSVRALGKTMGLSETQLSSYMGKMRTGLQALAQGHGKAGDEAQKAGNKMHEFGHALSRVGGPMGELVERLSGGRGLSGGMLALGMSMGVAGVAFEAFKGAMEQSEKRALALVNAQIKLRDAIQDTTTAEAQKAAGEARGAQGNRAAAIAAGGETATKSAEFISKEYGVPLSQAYGAAAKVYNDRYMDPHKRHSAMVSIGKLSRNGGMSPSDATSGVLKSQYMLPGDGAPTYKNHQYLDWVMGQHQGRIGEQGLYVSSKAAMHNDPIARTVRKGLAADAGTSASTMNAGAHQSLLDANMNALKTANPAEYLTEQAAEKHSKDVVDAIDRLGSQSRLVTLLELMTGTGLVGQANDAAAAAGMPGVVGTGFEILPPRNRDFTRSMTQLTPAKPGG